MSSNWESVSGDDEDIDLYEVLEVERDATEAEIRTSWRSLVKRSHPDKSRTNTHTNTHTRFAFEQIDYAYKVLSDPQKRKIYDDYGHKGLKLWPTNSSKSAEEQFAEFARLRTKKEKADAKKLAASTGIIKINVSAVRTLKYAMNGHFRAPTLTRMSVLEQFETHFTERNLFLLGSYLETNTGNNRFFNGFNRQISPFTSVFLRSWTTGRIHSISGGIQSQITHDTVGTAIMEVNTFGGSMALSLDRRLSESLRGQLWFQMGQGAIVKATVSSDEMKYPFSSTIWIDSDNFGVDSSISHKFADSSELFSGIRVSTSRSRIRFGMSREFLTYSKVSFDVGIGTEGITLNFSYQRLGHRLEVPILLSNDVTPYLALGSLLIPSAFVYILKRFILDPYDQRSQESKLRHKRVSNRARVNTHKEAAIAQIQSQMTQYEEEKTKEERSAGLVITRAIYGNLNASTKDKKDFELVCDVTVPLQVLIKRNEELSWISIGPHSKSELPGFYDPDPGQEKQLEVWYSYNNEVHHVIVNDLDRLRVPLPAHRVRS